MKVHKSKVDLWLMVFIFGTLFIPVLICLIIGEGVWLTTIICAPLALFVAWLYFATKYKITETELIVRGGLFTVAIPLESVTSIKATRNPISSPAFSLDRLEIKYGDNKTILISPKDKRGFLADIGWPRD